jgi:hypothetical protein
MIDLTHTGQTVPGIDAVPAAASFAEGSVYVADGGAGAVAQVVTSGQKAVVEVNGRKLELTTSGYQGTVTQPGTYVKAADAGDDVGKAGKIRLYGWGDRLHKWFSRTGVLVWAPALVGVLLAVSGFVFLNATSPADRATVADTAKDLQRWVISPPPSAPPALPERILLASRCLDGLAGRSIPADVQIPRIQCQPASPSWFDDKDNAALIALIGGAITAGLGLIASVGKLRFGQKP